MSDRDIEMGRELRGLEVPEHDPAFFAELRQRLDDVEPARSRRRPLLAWMPRRPVLRVASAIALAAVVLVVALVRDGGGPATRLGTPAATAAQVRATALRSWAALRSLSGHAAVRVRIAPDVPLERRAFSFWMTAGGDLRTREPHGRRSGYDPSTRTEVILGDPAGGGQPLVRRGLAPAAPDAHPADEVFQHSLAAVVRALREGHGGSVRKVVPQGRPAWLLRTRVPVNKLGFSGDTLEVVVDQASGLPLRARETRHGRLVQDLRLSSLRADGPARITAPHVPAGAAPLVTDDGFRRVAPAAVARAVRYRPLLPRWVPAGFARAETVVARDAQSTGAEGMNPRSRDVVSAAWRRGLDRLVVTTRRVGSSPRSWEDPLAPPEGFLAIPVRLRVREGALAGTTAQLVIDPRATPHLWARTPRLVVTVSGDLSRAELLRVAGSLTATGR